MRSAVRRFGHQRLLLDLVGAPFAVIYVLLVAFWIWAGFAAAWRTRLPEPLADLENPSATWPLVILAVVCVVTLLTLGADPRWRVGRPSITAGVLIGSAALIAVATAWPCAGSESPGFSALRYGLGVVRGDLSVPFGDGQPCRAAPPLGLQAAQLMAGVALVIIAARALAFLFTDRLYALRAAGARRIVVFSGVSDESVGLVRAVLATMPEVLPVVLRDAADLRARTLARQLRAVSVVLDLFDATAVRRLVGRRSTRSIRGLYLLHADAAANLRAMDVFRSAIRVSPTAPTVPPRLLVRLDDPWHAEDWRRRVMSRNDGWLVDAVSAAEGVARQVVTQLREDAVETVVLTGSSAFELAVLAELSVRHRIARAVAAGEPTLPTVVLTGAKSVEAAESFDHQLRRFGIDPSDVQTARPDEPLDTIMGRPGSVALLLGPDDAIEGGGASLLAARRPAWRIYAWDSATRGLDVLPLVGNMRRVGPTLDPSPEFGVDIWEWLARLTHLHYLATLQHGRPEAGHPSRGTWDDLSPFVRESNVRAVSTVIRSIDRIGRRWATTLTDQAGRSFDRLTLDELTTMAEAEHESWMAHHLEYGWRRSDRWNDDRRRHPALVPWADLPEAQRVKDVSTVRSALEMLETLGFTLQLDSDVPSSTPPSPQHPIVTATR